LTQVLCQFQDGPDTKAVAGETGASLQSGLRPFQADNRSRRLATAAGIDQHQFRATFQNIQETSWLDNRGCFYGGSELSP
jgi:hypothetical protein